MAVTVPELAAALRLTDGSAAPAEPLNGILTRLAGVSDALVTEYAPDAPEVVRDQAAVQLAAYLFDQPNAGAGMRYSTAFRSSGAASLLTRWKVRRAGIQAADDDDEEEE